MLTEITLSDNIYYAMRSLFRYLELLDMKSPQVLIDKEVQLLERRFKSLEIWEVEFITENWELFYEKEVINQELRDQAISNSWVKFIMNLN